MAQTRGQSQVQEAAPPEGPVVKGPRRRPWTHLLNWTPAAATLLYFVLAVNAGLPVVHAVRAIAAILVTQVLPGALLWRLVRPRNGWWFEDLVVGFAVGACLAVVVQTVAGIVGATWLTWSVGPLLALALWWHPATRATIVAAKTSPIPALWGPAVSAAALLLLLPTQALYRVVPLSWPSGFMKNYVDIPFHLALATQIAFRGPFEVPFVLGEPLRYHWFSHAWVAQVALAGDVPLDAVLVRIVPPLFPALTVFAVAAAAVRLSNRLWAGPLAAFLAVVAGELDLLGGGQGTPIVAPLSPSLAFSVLVSMALLALLGSRWKGAPRPGSTALVIVFAVIAAGAKGSAAPVMIAGLGLAVVVAWLGSWPRRRIVTTDAFLVLASSLVLYLVVFRGSTGGLSLDVVQALQTKGASKALLESAGVGAGTLLLAMVFRVFGIFARGAGLAGVFLSPQLRRDPVIPLLAGIGIAGAAAVILFIHPGQSQVYFLRNAVAAIAIGSAIGFMAMWDAVAARKLVLAVGAAAGLAVAVVQGWVYGELPSNADLSEVLFRATVPMVIFAVGTVGAGALAARRNESTRQVMIAACSVAFVVAATIPVVIGHLRPSLPPQGGPVPAKSLFAFSRDQIDAARWLRDHSDRDDVVATNRHCPSSVQEGCDGRRFFVAAYTERRVLVEGWAYTRSWATMKHEGPGPKPFWHQERLALNDSFLENPTARKAQKMRELGVDWVFIDKTEEYSTDLAKFGDKVYETEWAVVYDLRSGAA